MEHSQLIADLIQAESLMVEGQNQRAEEMLATLAEDAEEYVSRNCITTKEVQWFAFPTIFELLAYRKVEEDPRELKNIGEPLDRLYADLALACVRLGDYKMASEALKQAVRWNPMECGYRLDLAEIFATNGDMNEYLALTYSVFERASDVRHLARAYSNFAGFYLKTGREMMGASCLRVARRLNTRDASLEAQLHEAAGTAHDPDLIDDEEAAKLLHTEGIPDGANAEIAICMLMCATDAARAGVKELATNLTVRARDLVGAPACKALLELIHSADEEVEKEELQEELSSKLDNKEV